MNRGQIRVNRGQIRVNRGQIRVNGGQIRVNRGQISVNKDQEWRLLEMAFLGLLSPEVLHDTVIPALHAHCVSECTRRRCGKNRLEISNFCNQQQRDEVA